MSVNGREYEMRGKCNQTTDRIIQFSLWCNANSGLGIWCSNRGNTSITLKQYCTSSNEKLRVQYSFYVVYARYLLLHESGL